MKARAKQGLVVSGRRQPSWWDYVREGGDLFGVDDYLVHQMYGQAKARAKYLGGRITPRNKVARRVAKWQRALIVQKILLAEVERRETIAAVTEKLLESEPKWKSNEYYLNCADCF